MNVGTHLKNGDRGATLIIVAGVLIILIGLAAFAVDFGYRHVVRNELQNIADAAALAATRQLGVIYQGLSSEEQKTYVADRSELVGVAQETVKRSKATNENNEEIIIADSDVTIGQWDFVNRRFKEVTLNQPDAVRVVVRRDAIVNGPVPTFFAEKESMEVRALATAALSGQSTAEPGELELPVGISRFWFDEDFCNDQIKFYPTNDPDSCAGWNTYTNSPSNDSKLRDILANAILDPSDPSYDPQLDSPEAQAGTTEFEFIGGTMSNPTFDALLTAFQLNGYDVDGNWEPILDLEGQPLADATGSPSAIPLYEEDGVTPLRYPDGKPRNRHLWETSVSVYRSDDCSNPNQNIVIEGFARINVTDVRDSPEKTIIGQVICNYVSPEDTRGGGGSFGTKGSIPGLVE